MRTFHFGKYASHVIFVLHLKLVISPHMYRKKKAPSEQTNPPSMLQQTDPPSIPVTDLFPSGEFPEGEIQNYKDE